MPYTLGMQNIMTFKIKERHKLSRSKSGFELLLHERFKLVALALCIALRSEPSVHVIKITLFIEFTLFSTILISAHVLLLLRLLGKLIFVFLRHVM